MTAESKTKPKRRRRKSARPGEIIEAGVAEFAEKGFAATRLDDVAARAGVVKGTIYLYFDGKEDLFEKAVISRVGPAFETFEGLVAKAEGSSEDLLRTMITIGYRTIIETDAKALLRIIIAEGPRFPAITAFYHQTFIAKGQHLLSQIIRRGIERGEFREGPAADLPLVIMAPMILTAIYKQTFERHQPIPTDAFLNAHLDLIFGGLRAAPAAS